MGIDGQTNVTKLIVTFRSSAIVSKTACVDILVSVKTDCGVSSF